jgi:hypothetical protein
VAVSVAVAVAVAVSVAVAVAVAVGVSVAVAVAVSVAVAVAVAVSVAVAVGVAVAGGLMPEPVLKTESKATFSVFPLRALTEPRILTWYSVLIVREPLGIRVALLPLQLTPAAGTETGWPFFFWVLSRNELVVSELHFIAKLKTTVMEVSIGTLSALLAGSIDTTTGRAPAEAATWAAPAVPTIATINAASEIVLIKFLSVIVPLLIDDMAFISSFTCLR